MPLVRPLLAACVVVVPSWRSRRCSSPSTGVGGGCKRPFVLAFGVARRLNGVRHRDETVTRVFRDGELAPGRRLLRLRLWRLDRRAVRGATALRASSRGGTVAAPDSPTSDDDPWSDARRAPGPVEFD